jgi:hypothetical protein
LGCDGLASARCSSGRFGRACAALEPADSLRRTLATLGRRWLALDTEARELEAQITALLTAHAPGCWPATESAP